MPQRSRRGRGTVFYDDARKCWVGQLSLGRDPQTGKRRRSPKVTAVTEDECRDKLAEMLAELRKTGDVARRDVTVEMVLQDLLASPPAEWASPLTIQGNADRIARITAALGKTKLQGLTVGQVERMLRDMAADGSSTDAMRRARAILARAIRRAQRDGLVHRNVAELAEVPRGTRRQSRAMTLEQVHALLALKLMPFWRAYIVTALTCGLRPGELLGLRWEDVDFTDEVIRVRMCLKALPGPEGKRVLTLADLKTDRSRRTMQLPPRRGHRAPGPEGPAGQGPAAAGLGVQRQRPGVRHGVRRPALAPGRPEAVRRAMQAGRARRQLASARDPAYLGQRAVARGRRYRGHRRRGGPRQQHHHARGVPAPDRRQGNQGPSGDGRHPESG